MSRTGGLFPQKFTLTIEEHATLGWIVTSETFIGFNQLIMPEEGLPEGLRKVPGALRELLVARIDAERDRSWWSDVYKAGIAADLAGQPRTPPDDLTEEQKDVWLAGYDR
jgi:hypothetical protein